MCPLLWPLGVRRQGQGLALEASARPGGRTVGQVGPCPVGSRGRGIRAGTRRLRVGWIPASMPPPRAPSETRGSALSLGPPRPACARRGSPHASDLLFQERRTRTRHTLVTQERGQASGLAQSRCWASRPGSRSPQRAKLIQVLGAWRRVCLSDSHRLPDTWAPRPPTGTGSGNPPLTGRPHAEQLLLGVCTRTHTHTLTHAQPCTHAHTCTAQTR